MTTPAISAPTREVEGEVIWARPGVARPDVLWRHEAAFGLQRKQGGVKKHANQLASVSTAFIHDSPCGRVGGPQTGHVRGAGRLQLRTLSLQAAETREREPTWLLAGRWPGRRLRTSIEVRTRTNRAVLAHALNSVRAFYLSSVHLKVVIGRLMRDDTMSSAGACVSFRTLPTSLCAVIA